MTRELEERLKRAEERLAGVPCSNPEHGNVTIFTYGLSKEHDRNNDRVRESIRQCERCKGGNELILLIAGEGGLYEQTGR